MNLSEISPEAIISITPAMATAKVTQAASTLMLGKALSSARESGQSFCDSMRASLERSVNPAVGSHIDVSV